MRSLILIGVAAFLTASSFAAAPLLPLPAEFGKWLEQLGDEDEDTRTAAEKKLAWLGTAALPRLRAAAKQHADADVRLRARVIAAAIEKEVSGEVLVMEGHKGWVHRVVVLSDGKHAITSADGLRLWDIQTGKLVRTISSPYAGWGLSVSKDGKRVATCIHHYQAHTYDVETGRQTGTYPGHTTLVWATALSPDGKLLYTGGQDRVQRLHDLTTGKPAVEGFKGSEDYVRCAAFSPDGKTVAAGHYSDEKNGGIAGILRLWDAKTGKELWKAKGHEREITSVAFSVDGKRIATSSIDSTVRVWDASNGKELVKIKAHRGMVESVCFSHDGERLVSAGADDDKTIRVWDIATKREVRTFVGHTAGPLCVVATLDGKHVLSSAKDGTLRLWRMPR